jgi:23S rRNA (cytidine2498-2'-O)-methyltransferase
MKREPRPGDWLWACRQGCEGDLVEEIGRDATEIAPGLVRSAKRPRDELAFARQGFPVAALIAGDDPRALGEAIARHAAPQVRERPFALHVFVPDSDEANPLAAHASAIEEAALAALAAIDPAAPSRRVAAHAAPSGDDPLVQACLLDLRAVAVGVQPVAQAPSTAPGGRRRIGAPPGAPSRAAAKLLEAFDWLGRGPEPGDLCVDLGAAPGGWSFVLLARRARVIAVDPARLAPEVARHRKLRHVQASAFGFLPDEPVDWLCADMAWRPLEVAALLAKWGRQRAARFLVANVKLPMRRKVDVLRKVRHTVAGGGWRDVRARQLYHDRDEVTLGAWRL